MRALGLALALLLLAACGNSRRVERPLEEVQATLTSLPSDADAMPLATQFPGTAYWLEPDGSRLVWHFTHNGEDYGRLVATLSKDGGAATQVATRLESANHSRLGGNIEFLRKAAGIAGEASIAAALDGRPVDRAAVQQAIRDALAADPVAAQMETFAKIDSMMTEMAPEVPMDGDPKLPAYNERFREVNGRGSESWVE